MRIVVEVDEPMSLNGLIRATTFVEGMLNRRPVAVLLTTDEHKALHKELGLPEHTVLNQVLGLEAHYSTRIGGSK